MSQIKGVKRIASLVVLVGLLACNNTPPPDPPPTPPAPEPEGGEGEGEGSAGPEPIETGKDCATAEADCDGGMCTTEIKNNCETPITCSVEIIALCESETSKGEAKGKARGTIPGGKSDKLKPIADCEGQPITATMVDTLSCQ